MITTRRTSGPSAAIRHPGFVPPTWVNTWPLISHPSHRPMARHGGVCSQRPSHSNLGAARIAAAATKASFASCRNPNMSLYRRQKREQPRSQLVVGREKQRPAPRDLETERDLHPSRRKLWNALTPKYWQEAAQQIVDRRYLESVPRTARNIS